MSQLEKLPIKKIDFKDLAQKLNHDKMVSLVDQMPRQKKIKWNQRPSVINLTGKTNAARLISK